MIVFVPGYDRATNANLSVARDVVARADMALLADDATRDKLVDALSGRAHEALFSMSHGRPDHLCAQNGEAALTADDAPITCGRAVYAFACHTASLLGERMCQGGTTWWGYTGAIQCPEDTAPFRSLFVELFAYIRGAFHAASTREDRSRVLDEIARRCETAQSVVDEHVLRGTDGEVWAAYHCLLHIWDRLRVWPADAAEPEAHRNARPPSLFLVE